MNGGNELLKSIQSLKLVVNPFFFVTFHIKKTGFTVSKTGTVVVFCLLLITLTYKIYFILQNPGKKFEEYVENYSSLAPTILCVMSYFGYATNAKTMVKDLNQIISKSSFITDKQLLRKIFRLTIVQAVSSHVFPFAACLWISYHFYENYYDFLSFVGNTCFDYVIMLHFAATSLIFSNTILFCRWILTLTNEKLLQRGWVETSKSDKPLEKLFVNQETVSRIRLVPSNEFLVTTMLNYDEVCQWCLDFNEHFGAPLAACCICNWMEMIVYSYYVTKYGIVKLWMFVIVFWYCFMQNWVILFACEKIRKEEVDTLLIAAISRTAFAAQMISFIILLLPCLLSNPASFHLLSEQMLNDLVEITRIIVNRRMIETKMTNRKELLQQFSILLLHRKMKFTALGMFSLDYKLIYSALATVATYLTIAFQFEYASRSSQRNTMLNTTLNR